MALESNEYVEAPVLVSMRERSSLRCWAVTTIVGTPALACSATCAEVVGLPKYNATQADGTTAAARTEILDMSMLRDNPKRRAPTRWRAGTWQDSDQEKREAGGPRLRGVRTSAWVAATGRSVPVRPATGSARTRGIACPTGV